MASFLDKFKVNTAITDNTVFDLSCQHVTTTNFLLGQPVYNKEMVPGEKLSVHQESFVRLAPMPVPTFGRANMHNRAFFVPYRTVWRNWDNFIVNAPGLSSNGASFGNASVPTISNKNLVYLFASGSTSTTTLMSVGQSNAYAKRVQSTDTWDVVINAITSNSQHEYVYLQFTPRGKQVMKILQSLGYEIIWNVTNTYSATNALATEIVYNALPLLCWLRIYLDWYVPSAYADAGIYKSLQGILEGYSVGTGSNGYFVSRSQLNDILSNTWTVNYDSDYFTSAWDNPTTPIISGTTSFIANIDDQSLLSTGDASNTWKRIVTQDSNSGTPIINSQDLSQAGGITQYAVDALKALTDYMKRHQLVGSRAMDRFYARFGKSLPAEKLNRSIYLGGDNIPVQFGDVFSTSNTDGARLGDYAGKGLAYGGNDVFEYSTDEYGMFIIVSSIIPKVNYYGGQDRNTLHISATDFWTPEFDQLGSQAISKSEVFVPMGHETIASGNDIVGSGSNPVYWMNNDMATGVWGFVPRYAEYKIAKDRLTGDFRFASANVAGDTSDAWHLFRNPILNMESGEDFVHGSDFVKGIDWNQYNRIFYNTDVEADKFYIIHNFDVTSHSPMCPLFDTYDFEDKGKKVVADVNGVKVN